MAPEPKAEITDRNEEYVEQWFNAAGFGSKKLDVNNVTKSADWLFSRKEVAIVCEVKTIFSGGQTGIYREQYERKTEQARQRLERIRQTTPPNTQVLITRDDLDFAEGKVPYRRHKVYKEDAHNQFLEEIQQILQNHPKVKNLPFEVVISFSNLYREYDDQRKQQFIDWLVGFIIWAKKNHLSESYPYINSQGVYTFVHTSKDSKGNKQRSIEAHVQVWGPWNTSSLSVGYIFGGTPYNEQSVWNLLEDALSQLRHTVVNEVEVPVLNTIGLWPHSPNINRFRFALEMARLQPEEIPERYYLLDWAFEDNRDLAAIIFFELHDTEPREDFWSIPEPSTVKLFPYGLVITNPYRPDVQEILSQVLSGHSEHCHIITGFKET